MLSRLVKRTCEIAILYAGMTSTYTHATEVTESSTLTEYCVPQTLVRGGYNNLVIDHNMIIPPDDQFKFADVFVGARLKSDPDALWLLSGITWRSIDSAEDLPHSQHKYYEQLPLVVPVSIFNNPFDVSEMIGDLEIWIGYGFRTITESAVESFNEMVMENRYDLLWQAPPAPYVPANGLRDPFADICLETKVVKKTIQTVGPAIGGGSVVESGQ